MADKHSRLMGITGAAGLIFFAIANFTNVFEGASVSAGLIQFCLNAFVFLAWGRAFLDRTGPKKLFALGGVVVPPIMAGITTFRVLVPYFASLMQ